MEYKASELLSLQGAERVCSVPLSGPKHSRTSTAIRSTLPWLYRTLFDVYSDRYINRDPRNRGVPRVHGIHMSRGTAKELIVAFPDLRIPSGTTVGLALSWAGLYITCWCRLRKDALLGLAGHLDLGRQTKAWKLPGPSCTDQRMTNVQWHAVQRCTAAHRT